MSQIATSSIDGDGYGFDEVTLRDVRYLEQSKTVANSWAKGAKGLSGATAFTYDQNGNLALLDRGRKTGASENSVASFDYDLEGQIIGRADKATAATGGAYFEGFTSDPATAVDYNEYGYGGSSLLEQIRAQVIGNGSGATLQSYLYANNKALAEARGTQAVALRTLALQDAVARFDAQGALAGYTLTLTADDIVNATNGQVDRAATARKIAERHYAGFSAMGAAAQAKVTAYVQSQLPATIAAGTQLATLHADIVLADAGMSGITQITDYSLRRIGVDGLPTGSIQSHVVRSGDTLQSVAAIHFGSPSYWYLIAEANGLQGHEALAEGTTLAIPNKVVNAANSADTFKVYNESEIIGSTSPEIRTIKKKKKWYQKLIQILIVIIMVVVAIVIAIYAPVLLKEYGVVMGSLYAAAFGATAMAVASIATQGLAVAAGLQDKFSWKQVGKAAVQGAVAGLAAGFVAQWANTANQLTNAAVRVGVEAGKQLIVDGKIGSVAGLVAAAAGLKGVQGAALRMVAGKLAGEGGDNTMGWVSLASAAFFEGAKISGELVQAGELNWAAVAVQAIGAAIVTERRGGDAGRAYIGLAIGNSFQGSIEHAFSDRNPANANYRNEMDRESDSYTPAREYGYRNGADIDSDNATNERVERERMRAQYGQDGTGDVLGNHNGQRLNMPAAQDAALTPAQRAAMAAGYGPMTPEAAERLAQQGLQSKPRATAEAPTSGLNDVNSLDLQSDQYAGGRRTVAIGNGQGVSLYGLASGGPMRLGAGSVEPAPAPLIDSDNFDLMGTPRQVGVVGKDGARGAWGIAKSLAGEGTSNAEVNRIKNQLLALNPELADGVQKGQRYYVPDASTPENLALARGADRQYQASLAVRSQPSSFASGNGLSFDGKGASFSDLALVGASGAGGSSSLSGWQRAQAHGLGVYDVGAGAVEGAGYSFGVVGTPESRAAWALHASKATVEGIRSFVNDPKGAVSGWWDNLTGDDPAAIRQATAQGTGLAIGVAMGRLGAAATPAGLRTSALISGERAETFLVKNGFSADRAKDFVASFDGPITARLVRPSEEFFRYTDASESTGSFLTKTQFANPPAAVDGLYLGPYGNNATFVQSVGSTGRSIVLEGRIASGGVGIEQSVVVNRDAFQFGTGVRY